MCPPHCIGSEPCIFSAAFTHTLTHTHTQACAHWTRWRRPSTCMHVRSCSPLTHTHTHTFCTPNLPSLSHSRLLALTPGHVLYTHTVALSTDRVCTFLFSFCKGQSMWDGVAPMVIRGVYNHSDKGWTINVCVRGRVCVCICASVNISRNKRWDKWTAQGSNFARFEGSQEGMEKWC